jgi:hypothetical protein
VALSSSADDLQRCVDIARDVALERVDRGQSFSFLSRAGERLYAEGKGPDSFILYQLRVPSGKQPLRAVDAATLRMQVLQALAFFPEPEGEVHKCLRAEDAEWCHDFYVSQNYRGFRRGSLSFPQGHCPPNGSATVTAVNNMGGVFAPRRLLLPESVPDEARVELRIGITIVEDSVPAYFFRASTLGAGSHYGALVPSQRVEVTVRSGSDHPFEFDALLAGLLHDT